MTHLKEEYLKRNGVFHSDKIEVTQYLIRRGNYLTYPRHRLRPGVSDRAAGPQHGIPARRSTSRSRRIRARSSTEVDRPKGVVPHYLPGTNPDVSWFAQALQHPDGRGDGRRGQHVSGDPRRRFRDRSAASVQSRPSAGAKPTAASPRRVLDSSSREPRDDMSRLRSVADACASCGSRAVQPVRSPSRVVRR